MDDAAAEAIREAAQVPGVDPARGTIRQAAY